MKKTTVLLPALLLALSLTACGSGNTAASGSDTTPFDETEAYEAIVEIIDDQFPYTHKVEYDRNEHALNIYAEVPERTQDALQTQLDEVLSAWQGLSDSMCYLSETLLDAVEDIGDVKYINIYCVGELKNGGYTQADQLLWVQNGSVL